MFKKLILSLVLALSVPLVVACDVPPPVSTQGTLLDEKALFAAEQLYNTTIKSFYAAEPNLPVEARLKGRQLLTQGYTLLIAMRQAYQVGDQSAFTSQLVAFTNTMNLFKGAVK